MTSETKPTVLIVPGGCHIPLHYEPLTKVLSSHGFPSVALRLPTAGASPPDKDLHDDVAYITSRLEELVEKEGKEVIVTVHSYGGTPGPPAARPFVKKERAQQGKKGGVIGLLYISSWGVPSGKSTMESIEVVNNDWMKIEVSTPRSFRVIHRLILLLGANRLSFRWSPRLLQRYPSCRRRLLRLKACHPLLGFYESTSDC